MRNAILLILVMFGISATFIRWNNSNASFGSQVLRYAEENAANGDPRKIYRLGEVYERGNDVEKNFEKAASYYTLSAEKGYVEAQYKMGSWYRQGIGVEKNLLLAEKWYGLATEQGHSFAELALLRMQGVDHSTNEPLIYIDKSEFKKQFSDKKQLLLEIEESLDDYQIEYKNDTLYHVLARIYLHHHREKDAAAAKEKIQFLPNSKFMLELYAGRLLEELQSGDKKSAFLLLENTKDIETSLKGIKITPLQGKISRTPNLRAVSETDINAMLCQLAAKFLISEKRIDDLIELKTLKACETFSILNQYQLSYFLLNQDYPNALRFFIGLEDKRAYATKINQLETLLNSCLIKQPNHNSPSEKDVIDFLSMLGSVQARGNDLEKLMVSRLLQVMGQETHVEEIASTIKDKVTRSKALIPLYRDYLINNREDDVFRILQMWKALEQKPLHIGGWGQKDSKQWYNVSRPEISILRTIKTPLAYKVVHQYENPRTRFTALTAFDDASLNETTDVFPGCEEIRYCILDDMTSIAEQEKNDAARDYMYKKIASLAHTLNRNDLARQAVEKQVDPTRTICHFDMCSGGVKPDFTDPRIIKEKHIKMCHERLTNSDDQLLSVINQTEAKLKYTKKPDSSYRYVTTEDREHNQKIKLEGRNALRCHVSTEQYKEYLKNPDKLGIAHDVYLKQLANFRNSGSQWLSVDTEDRAYAALMIKDTKQREETLKRLFRYDREKNIDQVYLPVLDKYMKNYPDIFKEVRKYPKRLTNDTTTQNVQSFIRIWQNILSATALQKRHESTYKIGKGKPRPSDRIEDAHRILKERPDVATFLVENGAYHGRSCLYMEDYIPTPETIKKVITTEQSKSFHECIVNLVDAERYGQALYLAKHMFSNKNYLIRTKLEILQKELKRNNFAYKMSTIHRRYSSLQADYPFSENGFPFINKPYYRKKGPYARCPVGDVFQIPD